MTFLPIVERELRVMARQRSAYWMRFSAAAVALGLWFFVSSVSGLVTVPQRAQAIFVAISIASLVFAMLAGMFLTADCLSEERREGTLGLLFLTDLKGHDVVLGKLVSTSVLAFFSLLAVLPILALPLLMGGMSGGEFWRTALVLLVTIFFSLSTAMLVSALSKDSRVAMLGSLLVMIVLAGLLPVLWWLQALVHRMGELDFLLWACPVYTFRRGLAMYYSARTGPGEFWVSVATLSGLGIVSLVTASVLLPRVWQEAPSARVESRREPGRSRLRFGSPQAQMVQRVWLAPRPYYWLATRDRLPKLWAAICLGVLLPIWLVFFCGLVLASPSRRGGEFFAVAIFMSYGLHLIYKCLVAAEASRRLSEDRHSGALELLLATPLTPREIVRAQQDAVWDAFAWPRRLLVGVNLLLLWMMVGPNPMGMPGEPLTIFSLILLGGIAMLYLDTFALTRAGMWTALTAKRHTRAVLGTLRRVMLPSWLAVLLLYFFGFMMSAGIATIATLVVLWFTIGIFVDALVGLIAELQLREHFRAATAGVHTRPILAADGLPSPARELAEA